VKVCTTAQTFLPEVAAATEIGVTQTFLGQCGANTDHRIKMNKAHSKTLKPAKNLNKNQVILFGTVFAVVGAVVLFATHAAGFTASFEAENSTKNGQAITVSDSGASAGSALKFSSSTTCPNGQVGTPPNCFATPPAPLSAGKHWTVPFYEEFNGADYDHNKLTPCFDWNFGDCTSTFNTGYEHYEPSAIAVNGGAAHLNATPLSNTSTPPTCSMTTTTKCTSNACLNGTCIYKSGLLSTARKSGNDPDTAYLYKFTYGYVEANLKVVNQQGFFVAWWMLGADPTFSDHYDADGTLDPNGPWRYEIDILEELGSDPTDMEMHYHWGDGSNDHYSPNESAGGNGACAKLDYSKAFHRFGVDWEPTFVAFYIDGVKCGQHNATPTSPVPNVPMDLILNQMVNVNWQRSIGKPLLDTTLTSDLQADYIRVYQQAP
jgi:hypothetical protein